MITPEQAAENVKAILRGLQDAQAAAQRWCKACERLENERVGLQLDICQLKDKLALTQQQLGVQLTRANKLESEHSHLIDVNRSLRIAMDEMSKQHQARLEELAEGVGG